MIAKISDFLQEIVVAEFNGLIEIYLWPTLVAMLMKIWKF